MISRDFFIPSFSTILVAGMVAFLSCAQQIRRDEIEESFSSIVSEEESALPSQEIARVEDKPTESRALPPAEPTTTPKPMAATENETIKSEGPQQNENQPELSIALEDPKTEKTPDESVNSGDSVMSANINSDSPSEPKSQLPASVVNSAPKVAVAPVITVKKVSYVPRIPQKALKRKEGLLNRFYFVRHGDTPQSVSELIYGSPDKAHQLWVSKGKMWAPGRIIYYNSPQNPSDIYMSSFYKEQQVSAVNLKVKRGDWLSKIAQKYLGSSKSWSEIAIMNRINNPFDLKVGQKLILFPEIQAKPQSRMTVAANEPPVIPQTVTPPPAPEVAPSPIPEPQPRMPLAIEEKQAVKKPTFTDYIKNLIERFSKILKRKH